MDPIDGPLLEPTPAPPPPHPPLQAAALRSARLRSTHKKPLCKRLPLLIRRVHLYSGIFLVPWVLLYGITAFLFNHPELAPDRQRVDITSETSVASGLEKLPSATDLATTLLVRLAETEPDLPNLWIASGVSPKFVSPARFQASNDETSHTLSWDLTAKLGSLSTRPRRAQSSDGGWPQRVQLQDVPAGHDPKAWAKAAESAIHAAGHSVPSARLRSGPRLDFVAHGPEASYRMRYDVGRTSLSVDRLDEPHEWSLRSFLLRLHLAHGYPDAKGARWWWAVIVDGMAFFMVVWGLSGLFMWWQMRKMRSVGLVLVLSGFTIAAVLALVLFPLLT